MKVRELKDMLNNFDQDAEVHIGYTASDYWRSRLAPKADSVDEEIVVRSDYNSTDKIPKDDSEVYDEETGELSEGCRRVVVIS